MFMQENSKYVLGKTMEGRRMRLVETLMGGAVACLVLGSVPAKADDAVRLFAAGSLKAALTELAKD